VVDAATFEKRRAAFHRDLQEQFFSAWRVVGTERHTVRSGESLWVLTQKRRNLPVWLLRQYNPDVNLEELRPGTELTLPLLEATGGQAG
jgi:membrane-bound lytic murein transglycosylase D